MGSEQRERDTGRRAQQRVTAGQPTSPPTEGKLEEVEEGTSNSAEGETGYLSVRCTPGPRLSVSRHFPLSCSTTSERGDVAVTAPSMCQ